MSQVLLELETIQGLLRIVEHRSDGGSRAMAGDPPTIVLLGDACFTTQQRDQGVIDVRFGNRCSSIGEQKLNRFTGFVINFTQLLVNAVPSEQVWPSDVSTCPPM